MTHRLRYKNEVENAINVLNDAMHFNQFHLKSGNYSFPLELESFVSPEEILKKQLLEKQKRMKELKKRISEYADEIEKLSKELG